jgi:protein tyrosine/serine phosphatase
MRATVYRVDPPPAKRLAVMARPRAGAWLSDEITAWRAEGVDVVVCLLEPDEISELDLGSEADLCRGCGMEFISFPIKDRAVPASMRDAIVVAQTIATRMSEGKAVAVQCRAGIGRSALVAACTLVLAGSDPGTAFDRIAKARGVKVPDTDEQQDWLKEFRDAAAMPERKGPR